MRWLLDSVILIDHFNGVDPATRFISKEATDIALSPVTRAEVLTGFADEFRPLATELLDQFPTLPITASEADIAAALRRTEGWRLPDALQAAVARHNMLDLVTRNTKDFPPETVRLRNRPVRAGARGNFSPTGAQVMPASVPAAGEDRIPRVPLRPPSKVMRLARMGAFHPTRVSFVRTLVRRMARDRWRIERDRFDLDENGYGDVVYRIITPAGTLRFVAFSDHLDPSERTDRVIATQWDSTFVLTAAQVDDTLLADYRKNIPLQEAGRCHPFDLVLSRANRSVRLFEHVVRCLADGRQPAFAKLAEVGYLMRTTAVYGNGKFGVGDFEAVRSGGVFSLPFQAEMLTVYLARQLSFDLVEHIARARAPDRAVRLEPRVARCLGVGNATGLGMAPFLVTHPRLLDRWIHVRELGLARVRAAERAESGRVARFAELVERARRHVAQWRTGDVRQSARIDVLAAELAWLSGWSGDAGLARIRTPWDALFRAAESRGCIELEEMTLSLLLELHPELVDALEEDTGADERLATVPAMRVQRAGGNHRARIRLGARIRLRRSARAAPVLVLLRGEGGTAASGSGSQSREPNASIRCTWRATCESCTRRSSHSVRRGAIAASPSFCSNGPDTGARSDGCNRLPASTTPKFTTT